MIDCGLLRLIFSLLASIHCIGVARNFDGRGYFDDVIWLT